MPITYILTGYGSNFNNTYYALSSDNVGKNILLNEEKVDIASATLFIRGIIYVVNNYIDSDGTTIILNSNCPGFDLDFYTSSDYVQIKWNNTNSFDLTDLDEIVLKYE